MCSLVLGLLFLGIGFTVAYVIVKNQIIKVDVPPDDPEDHKSKDMIAFLKMLETTPNFTKFSNSFDNRRIIESYNDTKNMGGPITKNMTK